MMHKIKNKIQSHAGETIGETLVALLIGALALTMLEGAVVATSNMVEKSKDTVASYYDAADAMVPLPKTLDEEPEHVGMVQFSGANMPKLADQSIIWDSVDLGKTKIAIYRTK